MHHEGGQGVLGLLAHISAAVLQAGVELGQTLHQVRGHGTHVGQPLSQPAQQLQRERRGEEEEEDGEEEGHPTVNGEQRSSKRRGEQLTHSLERVEEEIAKVQSGKRGENLTQRRRTG